MQTVLTVVYYVDLYCISVVVVTLDLCDGLMTLACLISWHHTCLDTPIQVPAGWPAHSKGALKQA